ncbi:D-alanyl-D-alanine carboxypeptidase [Anaplasmataceae bacterium AB001_6]|nr:D-alanyl-D-alanine carboxypeptidase [Anaplasmataceae bacterium AB001_6]
MKAETNFFMQDYAGVIIETKTGVVKYNHFADKKIYPASLVKLLTTYIIFDKIRKSELSWDSQFIASEKAVAQVPSKIGLEIGEKVSVYDAILLLLVKSANDVAYMVAENIAGSEEDFAELMNQYADRIGMKNSHFINSSGLHDDRQYSTVTDIARLTVSLRDKFSNYYALLQSRDCYFKGNFVKGHNNILRNFQYATGSKTGFTYRSGFNVAVIAEKYGAELVLVIVGNESSKIRDQRASFLLEKYL